MGHADGPLVVFNDENDRQLPELRHVHAFEKLTVVAGSIAEERGSHGIARGITQGIALVAAGEGRSQGHGDAFGNEGEATKEVVLFGEEVHRATASLAAAGGFSEQLTHDFAGGNAGAQCMDMVSVGTAEPVVLTLHRADHAGTDGFLTVVEVDKAKHLAAVVHLRALVLKATTEGHVAVQLETGVTVNACPLGGHQLGQTLSMGTSSGH